MKHLIPTLALVFAARSASAQTLSLNDAISLGLDHNRMVANAALQVEKSDQDVAIARTKRLPTFKVELQGSQLLRPINLTFARGAFADLPGIGPVPADNATITTAARMNFVLDAQASQPLTQLIKLNLSVRLNEASREYQREQLRDARLGVVD